MGCVAVAVLVSSCSDDGNDRATLPTTTTLAATTSSSSSSSSSTTAVSTTTTVAARPTTSAPAASPEAQARTLFDAWARNDRAAAAQVAQAEAVTALFARQSQAGDGWSFVECSGAAGSTICAWQRPTGQRLLMRVQNAAGAQPIMVSEVRFQP